MASVAAGSPTSMPTLNQTSIKVSVILPTLNEAGNIVPLIEDICKAIPGVHEVIVVDDNSPDGTADLVERYARSKSSRNILVERRLTDHGLTKSLWHGIQKATGDVVVWMDCDFSMPPEVIPSLLNCIREGYAIAVGSRFVRGGSFKRNTEGTPDSPVAVFLSRVMNYAVQFVLDHSFKDYTSGFAAVRKSVFKEIPFRGDYGEYFIDFIFRALRRGYTVIEIPYVCVPRRAGESKTGQNLWEYFERGLGYLKTAVRLRTEALFSPKFPTRAPSPTAELQDPAVEFRIAPMRREDIPRVAGLHHQVLARSVNARLGIPFLESLYGSLLEDSNAHAWVAWHGESIAGFLTATRDLAATDRQMSKAISFKEKLSAGVRVLSSTTDLWNLLSHQVLVIYTRLRFGSPYPTVLTLGVSPLVQGKGVARLLMGEADAYFQLKGMRRYFVDTFMDNGRARRFYERLGFRYVGHCFQNALYEKVVPLKETENAATEASILAMSSEFDPEGGMARVCVLENENLLAHTDLVGKRVLEFGCGCLPATFGIATERLPAYYLATDTSQALLEAAKRNEPRVDYRVAMIGDPSIPKRDFDVLILRGVLHHLPNPTEALLQLQAYLKPGGELLLYEPNLSCIPGNIAKWVLLKGFGISMEDSPYGQLPRETILNAIRDSGFRLQDEWYTSLLAFWLSGDYGRKSVIPNWHSLFGPVVWLDRWSSRLLHVCPPLARALHLRSVFRLLVPTQSHA